MKKFCVVVFLMLCAAQFVCAGPIMDSVDPAIDRVAARDVPGFERANEPKREGFLSTTNLILSSLSVVTAITDVESTLACVSASTLRVRCGEANPLFRGNSRSEMYLKKAGIIALVNVPAYLARRSDSKLLKTIGYALPISLSVSQAGATVVNLQARFSIR